MSKLWSRLLGAGLAAGAVLSCFKEVREETHLRLQLDDTLALYDSVEVALVRLDDSTRVIAVLFNDPLPDPRRIPSLRLPEGLADGSYRVRIRAWKFEDQLGVEIFLRKSGDRTEVVRNETLTVPTPYLRTLGSIEDFFRGIWIPAVIPFNPEVTEYQILVALNLDTVQIYPGAQDHRAQVFVDGELFLPSSPIFKPVPLEGETRVSIVVRNNNQEKEYVLRFRRDSRAGPHLTHFVTDPGNWSPPFHPDSLRYTLATNEGTLEFRDFRADEGVEAYVDTVLVPAGTVPPTRPLQAGENAFTVRLADGLREQLYRFTVMRATAR